MTSPNLDAARLSLDGLSLGDSFGERFFVHPDLVDRMIATRAMPAMHSALARIREGESWSETSRSLFAGTGSFGNGSAMRVAPIGAAFSEDMDAVIDEATRSSVVTHAHPEGVAGAIAIAVATAWACRLSGSGDPPTVLEFIELVLPHVPDSDTRAGIARARTLDPDTSVRSAVEILGNGTRVICHDTVPFTIWSAAKNLGDFEEAMWHTVSALGDRDTTCAIVGGIVAAFVGEEGLPSEWLDCREPLAEWRE